MAQVWVGTSGFSYKEWKGIFYPEALPGEQMLAYYASRFRTVEIDSTFYRMPTETGLQKWADTAPPNFRFAIKAPQQITHRERLRLPSGAVRLTEVTPTLGEKCGLIGFQLPPNFKIDLPRLEAFLATLPAGLPYSFEFRHASWFTAETYALLRQHRVVLCVLDTDEGCSPDEITASSTYVRLRRSAYASEQREAWRARFREWADSGIEVFAYVKHKDNPNAPLIALEFAAGF